MKKYYQLKSTITMYLAIIMLLSIFSCSKSSEISGQLLTYGSEVPVDDALIKIYEFIPSGEWGTSGSYRLLDSTRTDINGRYYFSDIEKEMYATIEKEMYFPIWRTGDLILGKNTPKQKVYLKAEAYVYFEFFDSVEIPGNSMAIRYNSVNNYYHDIHTNTEIEAVLIANKYNIYYFNINAEGWMKDSILINSFVTDTLKINF